MNSRIRRAKLDAVRETLSRPLDRDEQSHLEPQEIERVNALAQQMAAAAREIAVLFRAARTRCAIANTTDEEDEGV